MRTHIELDDKLIAEVQRLGGFRTKKAAVNAALAEHLRQLKRKELLALEGKVEWVGNLDELRAQRQVNEH